MLFQKFLFLFILLFLFGCNPTKKENETKISTNEKDITWSKQIAPIIFKNCTACHRPGESGPFNLLNYADVVKKAKLIKFVTGTRYMPPWPADADYTHFVGERGLTKEEIDLIKLWVDNGLQHGDSLSDPKAPEFYTGSYFGKPDLVIKPQQGLVCKKYI